MASLRGRDSEITRLLDRARTAGITVKVQKGVYNNWGGFVTNEDVRSLPIEIAGPNLIYKNGACVRLHDGADHGDRHCKRLRLS